MYDNNLTQLIYYLQKYYSTVEAMTTDGVTKVTSNGITIVPVDVAVTGLEILDGHLCTFVQR